MDKKSPEAQKILDDTMLMLNDFELEHIYNNKSSNNIVKSPGSYEGEPIATVYFESRAMDGDGENYEINEDESITIMEVSEEEKEAFDLEKETTAYSLHYSSIGFITGSELTDKEYDKFLKKYEADMSLDE